MVPHDSKSDLPLVFSPISIRGAEKRGCFRVEAIISYHFTPTPRKESDSFSSVVVVKDVTTALKNRGKANIKITEEEKKYRYITRYFF